MRADVLVYAVEANAVVSGLRSGAAGFADVDAIGAFGAFAGSVAASAAGGRRPVFLAWRRCGARAVMVVREEWSAEALLDELTRHGSLLVPHWSSAWPTINSLSRQRKLRVIPLHRWSARIVPAEMIDGQGCAHAAAAWSVEPHECPYQADINGDHETLCRCCEACVRDCSDNR